MELETGKLDKVLESDMEISGVEWLENKDHLGLIRVKNYFTFEVTSLNLQSRTTQTIYTTEKLLRNLSKSPKRNTLVFEEWSERYSVWKADINDNGKLENYRPFLDIADKSWHPQSSHSGKLLAYISTKSGHNQLWIYDLEKKSDRQLTDITKGVIRNPRWSPDDSRILLETFDDSNFDLHAV